MVASYIYLERFSDSHSSALVYIDQLCREYSVGNISPPNMGFVDNVDPVFTYMLLSAGLKYYYNYLWKDVIPVDAKLVGVVTSLHLFPMKSGKGIEQQEIKCSSFKGPSSGPVTDR